MSDKAIRLEHVTKDYGEGRGIFDISLEVERGEVFGYVGTNGAGKTTTIRNMMGFIHPDSGEMEVDGMDPTREAAEIMHRVSYIPGEIGFPNLPTGTAFLKSQATYNKITDFTYMNYVIKKLDLDPSAPLKRMSKGMKQKTAIVAALMGDRDILVLDEPTTGLDPLMRDNFLELLRAEKGKGRTIFMSGHIFEEMEDVCDHVAMLKDGRIISTVDMYELRHNTPRNFELTFPDEASARKLAERMRKGKVKGRTVNVAVPPEEMQGFLATLADFEVANMRETNMTLQQAFMEAYGYEYEQ